MRIERHALARLLTSVTKAVPGRTTIPILGTVRLVADGQNLTVTATDLDIEISGAIPAEGAIEACVDAKLFATAVGKIAGTEIELAIDDNVLAVKAGRSRYKLATLPVDDFPTMNYGDFAVEFEADMSAVLGQHAFAMSDESTRYYLCGVFLEPDNATATNGHKLSTAAFGKLADFPAVIVPAATVALAPKGNAKVRLSSTKIQFCTDDYTLTSKLIDGTYPDWRRIMPAGDTEPVTVDNDALRKAAERVAVVASDKEPAVKLVITSDNIALSAAGENGNAVDDVPCAYGGPEVAVGFNARLLGEILASLTAGDIQIVPADGMGPVLFTSKADDARRVVCMPRRV